MRPHALFATLLAALAPFARADSQPATQSPRDPIRVTSLNDGRFLFVQGRTQAVLDLKGNVNGCLGSLYDGASGEQYGGSVRARVLDQTRRSGFWYVVMQVNTNTGCNVQGRCGAGFSADVIWLKLDARLRVAARQALSVENCATETSLTRFDGGRRQDGDDALLELRGGVLSLESTTNDYIKNVTTVTNLRYDRRTPERGLVISKAEQPLK